MAEQKNVLTETKDGSSQPTKGGASKTLRGGVGILSMGKPGDVIETSFGPVVKSDAAATDTAFGSFVSGKGILVNSGDCEGIASSGFDTKTLKAGQVGSFLVSGACVVKCTELTSIRNYMRVEAVIGETTVSGDVCIVAVNGFTVPSREEVRDALKDIPRATMTNNQVTSALVGKGLIKPGVSTINEQNTAMGTPASVATLNERTAYFS